MRIFYAVHDHYWEDANLLAGLQDGGHDVVPYRPASFHTALSTAWTDEDRARSSERLLEALKREHARQPFDLVFMYVLDRLIEPAAIEEIRRLGIPAVNYWCNGAHQFHLVQEISAHFDACVVAERGAMRSYAEAGARAIYLQMGANPNVYKPYDLPREFDVTFVGQRYADRPEYVAYLLANGVDVRVWGPGWTADRTYGEKEIEWLTWRYALRHPRSAARHALHRTRRQLSRWRDLPPWQELRLRRVAGPSLPYEDLVKMYSRSRISLGFSTCGDARYRDTNKIRQVHLRDFEGPMSGAFYFVEQQDELAEFYEIGKEIVCYESREDLLDKVRYYLAHPGEAEAIRAAGCARARRDHTWARRFEQLFAAIGLAGDRPSRERALSAVVPVVSPNVSQGSASEGAAIAGSRTEARPLTVSAVIPTYNRANLLGRAVRSAFDQTRPPDEVLVVDDGSQDDSLAVLEQLRQELGERLRWVRQPNGGESSARNAGVANARGDLIAFLDSDDLWFPDKLAAQVAQFEADPKLALSFAGYVWDEAGTERPVLLGKPWRAEVDWVLGRLIESCCITPSTTVIRKTALDAAGPFDLAMRVSCDWDMWCRIVAAGFRTAYLPQLTARYFWHDTNMSRDARKTSDAALYIFTKLFGRSDLDAATRALERRAMARWHMIHAENCLLAGHPDEARQHIVKAAATHPPSIRPGWIRIFLQSLAARGGSPERAAS